MSFNPKPLLAPLPILGALALQAADHGPIQRMPLDHRSLVRVPVATNRVTTFSLPGPITAIDGAGVSTDPKVPAGFQLAHTPGAAFFSVRALQPAAEANLNVRWNRRIYVFELVEASQAPLLSLELQAPERLPVHPAPRLGPERLLGLLDRAKAFPVLKAQHPHLVAGVEFRTFTDLTTDFGDFRIDIEEAYRFDPEDTLVFRVRIHNRSAQPLEYLPGSFQLRAGRRLYPQSISDASGLCPPGADSTVYFAVTGTPDGGRHELSLKNRFAVRITRLSPRPAGFPSEP